MLYLNTHRYFSTLFLFILTTVLPIRPSFAKMQATQMIPAKEVTRHYKSEMTKGKLTADEVEIMKLATVAEEVFEVKDFSVSGYHSTKGEKVKSVRVFDIANSIQQAVQKKVNWNDALPKENLNTLKKEAALLKKALGENSLGWTWYLYQVGNKAKAQKILSSEFERVYLLAMKLTEISGFEGSSPSWEAESLYKALIPLSSENENKLREEKVQKMRLHISHLPNMQMMT
jgi:hypothetical protein